MQSAIVDTAPVVQAPATGTPTEQAHAKVLAVGAGYLRFAHTETGAFLDLALMQSAQGERI